MPNGETKKVLSDFFNKNHCEYKVKEFMLFENKGRKDLETYRKVQRDTKEFIRDFRNVECKNTNIQMIKTETGKYYTLHTKHHYVSELKTLLGENEYQRFINSEGDQGNELTENQKNRLEKTEILQIAGEMLNEFMKSSGVAKDPNEDEFKRRRKKRK